MAAEQHTREDYIAGLRACADWLEGHPDVSVWWASVSVGRGDAAVFRQLAAAGATVTDSPYVADVCRATLAFGPVALQAEAKRDLVQRKVVVGYERVDGRKVPVHEWKPLVEAAS